MDANFPDRPSSATCYKPAYLDEYEPDAREEIAEMVEIMKQKKFVSTTTGHWSLDAFSHYTWRVARQKNQKRDFPKFAIAAYYEEMLVSTYRQKLFNTSEIARFLCNSLRVCLSTFIKQENIIHNGKIVKNNLYKFPDDLKVDHSSERPDIDVELIIADNDEVNYITNACKTIQALKKSIGNNSLAKRIPGSSVLNPAVANAINNLEIVRLFHFLSSHLTLF
jgi:predicted RNA-binding protein YlqC (UPF0109 family)